MAVVSAARRTRRALPFVLVLAALAWVITIIVLVS